MGSTGIDFRVGGPEQPGLTGEGVPGQHYYCGLEHLDFLTAGVDDRRPMRRLSSKRRHRGSAAADLRRPRPANLSNKNTLAASGLGGVKGLSPGQHPLAGFQVATEV